MLFAENRQSVEGPQMTTGSNKSTFRPKTGKTENLYKTAFPAMANLTSKMQSSSGRFRFVPKPFRDGSRFVPKPFFRQVVGKSQGK